MGAALRTGDMVAVRYRVERVLGTGGMGVVVAARHVETGELRAVKVMNREPAEGAGWAERFRREALVGQRLSSEHAVRVLDVGGFDEGRPWLVMEHLVGTDLGKMLRKRGPLPVEEAAGYVSAACDAIAEAHAIGVVHRDLKPANLFLAKQEDGSSCLKVLDFGISKVSFADDRDALSVTQSGEVIGSPAYMAPEQIRSFGEVDPRSDVWALGVILYELLTGKWPFPGKASVEMIAMVLERKPDPVSKYRAGLPPALEDLLLRCVEKDLGKRLASASELRQALEPFLAPDDADDRPTPVAPMRAASIAPPPEPVVTTGEQPPVSVPPASTASQAVQRTLPIEPRAGEGSSRRSVYAVAAACAALVVLMAIGLLRRSPVPPSRDDVHRAVATVAPSGEPAATTAQPAETSEAPSGAIASTPSGEPAEPAPADSASPAEDASPADSASSSSDPPSDGVWRPWNRPGGKPLVERPRKGDGRHVDPLAAAAALRAAALSARRCKRHGGPTGAARVDVSFAPSGVPSSVRVGAPFSGTAVGRCIVGAFRGARMPAFQGSTFTASKTVTIK